MPLRQINNPTPDNTILNVLKALLPNDPTTGLPNTVIGQEQTSLNTDQVYVEEEFKLSQGNFPAVLLSSGPQNYTKMGGPHMQGGLYEVIVEYYDRWDQQQTPIDDIRSSINADLERMKANIEDNDSLAYQGKNYAVSIPHKSLSPYKGEIDESVLGLKLVKRTMTLSINILPYDAA